MKWLSREADCQKRLIGGNIFFRVRNVQPPRFRAGMTAVSGESRRDRSTRRIDGFRSDVDGWRKNVHGSFLSRRSVPGAVSTAEPRRPHRPLSARDRLGGPKDRPPFPRHRSRGASRRQGLQSGLDVQPSFRPESRPHRSESGEDAFVLGASSLFQTCSRSLTTR